MEKVGSPVEGASFSCHTGTLSMVIITWVFLPVNRNTVPVCVICAPIWSQKQIVLNSMVYNGWQNLIG